MTEKEFIGTNCGSQRCEGCEHKANLTKNTFSEEQQEAFNQMLIKWRLWGTAAVCIKNEYEAESYRKICQEARVALDTFLDLIGYEERQ